MRVCMMQVPGRTPLLQLLNDALILAKRSGHDVYNALDLMQNMEVFKVSRLAPCILTQLRLSEQLFCCPLLLCLHMLRVSEK